MSAVALREILEDVEAIPATRYCPHCQQDQPLSKYTKLRTKCDDCNRKTQGLANKNAKARALKETLLSFMGSVGVAPDGPSLNRLISQITDDLGGTKRVARLFADNMLHAAEHSPGSRVTLEYFKAYAKMMGENEKNMKDIDSIRSLSDEDLGRMLLASMMEDAGDGADGLLKAMVEARGMKLIDDNTIDGEVVNGPGNITADK